MLVADTITRLKERLRHEPDGEVDMRRWPYTLPGHMAPGFVPKPFGQSDRTDMEKGAPRVRRRTFARRYETALTWVMTDAEFAAFSAWYEGRAVSLAGSSDDIANWSLNETTRSIGAVVGPDLILVDVLRESTSTSGHSAQLPLPGAAFDNIAIAAHASLAPAGRDRARVSIVSRASVSTLPTSWPQPPPKGQRQKDRIRMNELSKSVQPVRPVAPWLGGKRNLAKRICALIDATPCSTYGEAFVGMGGIFLRRTSRPRAEVINDAGRDITTLFRILQHHYPQFLEVLRFQLTTRTEFNRLVDTNPDTLTDLERAARFLYLQRTAFGGKVSGRNFGVAADRPGRFNLTTLEPMLEDLHSRLSGVVIECLDFGAFLTRYDTPGTLFYLDPPYWGCEGDYGKELFARADFQRLAGILRGLEGRFILSLNDVPGVRETFAGFEMVEVKTTYTIASKGGAPERAELLISNYAL